MGGGLLVASSTVATHGLGPRYQTWIGSPGRTRATSQIGVRPRPASPVEVGRRGGCAAAAGAAWRRSLGTGPVLAAWAGQDVLVGVELGNQLLGPVQGPPKGTRRGGGFVMHEGSSWPREMSWPAAGPVLQARGSSHPDQEVCGVCAPRARRATVMRAGRSRPHQVAGVSGHVDANWLARAAGASRPPWWRPPCSAGRGGRSSPVSPGLDVTSRWRRVGEYAGSYSGWGSRAVDLSGWI